MSKCKILFLGTRPLAEAALNFLLSLQDVDIVGINEPDDADQYWNKNLTKHHLPIIKESNLHLIDHDLLVSVNYTKLIKEPLLNKARLGAINIHHSYNLRLRGRHTATHAILLARSTNVWEHGTSLHFISKELDAGQIIASSKTNISEYDTSYSLFNRCENLALAMIQSELPKVWRENIKPYSPDPNFYSFRKRDLPSRSIDLSDPIRAYDLVRSLTFPPIERPYLVLDNNKQYLTIDSLEGKEIILDIGNNRKIFSLNN